MLNWLRRLHAEIAAEYSALTAQTPNVTGTDASEPVATSSASPSSQASGSSLPVPSPSPQTSEASMKDVLQAKTLRALHEAIELHCRSMYGSGILTNFVVIAETVDADLDKETDKRSLQLLTSSDMTAWALVGYSAALSQAVYSGTI